MGDSEHEAPREYRQPTGGRRDRRRLGRLYDLDRSARCAGQDQGVIFSKAFFDPETQKIAWDSIWGGSATEVDASLNLPSAQNSSERILPWIYLPSRRILRTASKRSQHTPKYRLPFVLSIFTATSFSSTA